MKKILLALRYLLVSAGSIFTFCLIFAFTTGPFHVYHWLGTSQSAFRFKPTHLVVLGGGGFPGESALLRCWYTSQLIRTYPEIRILISQAAAVSGDSVPNTAEAIRLELLLRGADSSRISFLNPCRNTREEALQAKASLPEEAHAVIITSPEHMRRAIKCFRKAGIETIGGVPAFPDPGMADLLYQDGDLGGNRPPLPGIGRSTQLRYQVWNHLHYQLICGRELLALGWYALRGWT